MALPASMHPDNEALRKALDGLRETLSSSTDKKPKLNIDSSIVTLPDGRGQIRAIQLKDGSQIVAQVAVDIRNRRFYHSTKNDTVRTKLEEAFAGVYSQTEYRWLPLAA